MARSPRHVPPKTSSVPLKVLYDSLASSMLKAILFVSLCAWLLHLAASMLAALAGAELSSVWQRAEQITGFDSVIVRLVLFAVAHLSLLAALYRPTKHALAAVGTKTRPIAYRIELERKRALTTPLGRNLKGQFKRARERAQLPERLQHGLGLLSTAMTTALLALLLLQPTLVPLRIDRSSWLERAANLLDGTASASLVDSFVAVTRWWSAVPAQPTASVDPLTFDVGLDEATVPLMDRWDPYLLEATDGDRELFAKTKAFMWVESGGRQFALSATGCAGLMQFCAATAQRRPFHSIFGAGAVLACGCSDCSVPRAVQVALETDPAALDLHRETFPCDLSDARFDAERSVRAGVAYVRELGASVGGQLPLMYVGYNSGPGISTAIYRKIGGDEEISIADLRPHLASALRPYYGARANARANGLLDVHLPKLMAAYERWK